ncbi:MAG: thioredoxin domain-containing protein, partial [Patescibacteria group bacterium]
MTENKNSKRYKTHWHSFWFGFMSSLSIVLFFLLIGTVAESITFNEIASTSKTITKKPNNQAEQKNDTNKMSFFENSIEDFDINKKEFLKCVEEERYADKVQEHNDSGLAAGVNGTPHSFVLVDDALYEIPGAQSEKGMREFFDDLLAGNELKARDISKETTVDPVTEADWTKGAENARITVIEYSDVDCPFCKKFHVSAQNIMKDYGGDI